MGMCAKWALWAGLAVSAYSADLSFTGNLRFVSETTINIRQANGIVIDARLPKTGELASAKILERFKFSNQVQISCKGLRRVDWDDSVKRYHQLELTGIRLVRTATPEEIIATAVSLSWQPGHNLLANVPHSPKPPKAPEPEGLARVREVNLAHVKSAPNFVADEVAVRSLRRKKDSQYKQVDTVESEIGYRGDDFVRNNIRINGKPFKSDNPWLPGVNWSGAFNGQLDALLEPDCANAFELAGREQLRGKSVIVYRYNSPLDGCFGEGTESYSQYAPAHTGRILVDEAGGDVLQMENQDVGVPAEWE